MDVPSLTLILGATLSPSPDDRNAAEHFLTQVQYTPEHTVRLLQIMVDGYCDMAVRQVASIHFKNFIAKNWPPHDREEQSKISQTDKAMVRDNILGFVAQLPPLLRVQLGASLKTIIHADYPERWPGLLHWVKHNLQTQQFYGALFVLQILAKKYEFKSDEESTPVYLIVEETFSPLLNLFNKLVQVPNPPLDVADLIKLICKIFWSSIYMEIPKQLFESNLCNAWMVLFLTILKRPVPLEGQPTDLEQRKSWGWWKVKKWTVHILNSLYTRFGDMGPQNPENKVFAQMFQKNYAGKILECHLTLLSVIRTGGYLPDKVVNLILQYLTNSISKNTMYQMLQPHMDILLFEIIFPLMCFNDNDQRLWEEDPYEYLRKDYDIVEDLYSPRTAALDFVSKLVRKRGKDYLQKFIQFVLEILKRYDEAPLEHKSYRQKDGALLAIGALCDKLKQTTPYKDELECMLVQHVFSEFNSPAGHLRAKAAWVAGQYAHVNFSDQNNFHKALHSVVAGLRDPELPVRVESVYALHSFVEACKDMGEIRPILPQLLGEFFKLMNDVENEDIVFTLETIVDKFGEEIAPYAFGLCQNLVAAFWKCMSTAEVDDEADDPGIPLTAVGCLRAISTILKSVSNLPHLFGQIESTLLPIMHRMVTTYGQEVIEEVLEIVSYMTFFSPTISVEMWSLWPLMMDALEEWAIDFFPNMLVPLDNYISRGTDRFLTCKDPDYQLSLWNMISSVMRDRNLDGDIEPAPKLIEVVFQNCRGQVDHWVEPYLGITIECLHRTEKHCLKCLLIQVIANALYYNPSLALSILHKLDFVTMFFNLWFQMLQGVTRSGSRGNFKRKRDKKVCCLGLISLLSLPAEQLPIEALGHVFRVTLELLAAYKDQVAAAKENDDEVDEADSNNRNRLAAMVKAFRPNDEDYDDSDDDYSDDGELQSPIDEVDPFILFVDTVKVIQASDPLWFQNLIQTLELKYLELANRVVQHADQRRVEIQKDKLLKASAAASS